MPGNVLHGKYLRLLRTFRQILVTGHERVDQLQVQGALTVPVLARGHARHVELRPPLQHELLEQLMGVVQFFLEFPAVGIRVPAENGQGALVLAGGQHLEIDVVLLQQAMEVRQLRHHADRAHHGEGSRQDLVAEAGHHVAAAGRHLVDANGEGDFLLPDAIQLRSRQAITVHHAARALQADYDFVMRRIGECQDGGDFTAQQFDGRGANVAMEIQHVDARFPRAVLFFPGLFLMLPVLLLGLPPGLEGRLVENGRAQGFGVFTETFIHRGDFDTALCLAAPAPPQVGNGHHDDEYGNDNGDGLGQEKAVLEQQFDHGNLGRATGKSRS